MQLGWGKGNGMKTVKRKTGRQGTRRMINAQAVTPYGLLTYRGGETAFFLLRPTCISVMPEDALAARVGALVTVFKLSLIHISAFQ